MKRNVIITGASGNLGKATVETFLAEDYTIIATVSPGKSLGYKVKGDIHIKEVDLTNEQNVKNFIIEVVNQYKSIDVALLLVGGFVPGTIANTDGSALRKMITLNFETAYFTAQPIFSQMQKQTSGGRIIMIGSKPAIKPTDAKNALAYGLSKSLVLRLAEVLNAEGAKNSIVTHVIIPSTMDTPDNRNAMPGINPSEWVQPEDIAKAMTYLCSEKGIPIREGILKIYGNS